MKFYAIKFLDHWILGLHVIRDRKFETNTLRQRGPTVGIRIGLGLIFTEVGLIITFTDLALDKT